MVEGNNNEENNEPKATEAKKIVQKVTKKTTPAKKKEPKISDKDTTKDAASRMAKKCKKEPTAEEENIKSICEEVKDAPDAVGVMQEPGAINNIPSPSGEEFKMRGCAYAEKDDAVGCEEREHELFLRRIEEICSANAP